MMLTGVFTKSIRDRWFGMALTLALMLLLMLFAVTPSLTCQTKGSRQRLRKPFGTN